MGHTKLVGPLAFRNDGVYLASGSDDTKIMLYAFPRNKTPNSSPVSTISGNTQPLSAVAFSPNGNSLASGGFDRILRLWNVKDPTHPRPLGTINTGDEIHSLSYSPDGHTLASASTYKITMWDVANPGNPKPWGPPLTGAEIVQHGPSGNLITYVSTVTYSPDGKTLATTSTDPYIRLWNVANPQHPTLLGQLRQTSGDAYGNVAYSAVYSKNGKLLISTADASTIIWPLTMSQIQGRLCRDKKSQINPTEWRTYIPALSYNSPCK
jgi:WD40 repeat protein